MRRWMIFVALACVAFAPPRSARPLAAEELSPPLMEAVLANRRAAAAYLRTGNTDLALVELDHLAERLKGSNYSPFATQASRAVEAGQLDLAARQLAELGDQLAADRKRLGFRLLVDCVREASAAYSRLDVYRTRVPDLTDAAVVAQITRAAQDTHEVLGQCDREAPALVGAAEEFRRLIDGARASLKEVPGAAARRDGGLLHRFLIELRSIEQLLLFRYG